MVVAMTAKTTAERQRAYKASQRRQGLTEVRGIFAKPDQHKAVKEAVFRFRTPAADILPSAMDEFERLARAKGVV